MIEVEIDGIKVEVPEGSMVMEATSRAGKYVPHFCYHKKLSIAANCRMCLVDVEKAPKPLPACATPVTPGMIVRTSSNKAIAAQKGVMEFLLINHPLDCPICDQGGECQLQDLAVGYGASNSRYAEEKRVVFYKEVGPLISARDMARCIHCTRCVRFGQEIAGVMELGMIGRGEHSEIVSFVGKTVDSELSGNMIDVCPVGALTSKPFRYQARTWELARRRSIAPHDSLGSNIIVQVKGDKVLRVLPAENESINECWLSDKDRFSYEGLFSPDRVTKPLLKRDDEWVEADWETVLSLVATGLKDTAQQYGASAIGMLASPHSTLEELALAADLVRGLGSDNIDSRLRQTDFSADGQRAGIPWLGMDICDIAGLDAVLVVGSQLRKDHPLFAQRLRQAAKQGTKVFTINAFADQSLISLTGEWVVVPSSWEQTLAELLVALSELKKVPMPVGWSHVQPSIDTRTKAQILIEQANTAIFLGNACVQHPAFSRLAVLAEAIADLLGGKLGYLTEAANTVGAHVAGAVPRLQGLNAAQMLSGSNNPLKAMLLLNTEPDFDSADGQQARTALQNIPFVVALSVFRSTVSAYANIILPITPFTETSGTFINCEGRAQSFQACTKANGDSRPAWKVLRVLGNLLNLPGFDADSSEEVKQRVLPGVDGELRAGRLDNHIRRAVPVAALILSEPSSHGLERIAEVPIYRADVLVRRSQPLQETRDSSIPLVRVHPETAALHGLTDGAAVNVSAQGKSGAQSTIRFDAGVAKGAVRFAAGHEISLNAGALYEHLEVSAVMQEARQV